MQIYSIFRSISGEVDRFHQGVFTTFIRTAGCNLKCKYCDTLYAQDPSVGKEMSVEEIVEKVLELRCPKVTITGGEPLLQSDFFLLIKALTLKGILISVETNGCYPPLPGFGFGREYYVGSCVVDYKLLNSGMRDKMNEEAFIHLRGLDFVKFVVGSLADCIEAVLIRKELERKGCGARFAFSPLHGELDPKDLIQYLEKLEQFDAIVNLQLHKYIGLKEDK